MNTMLGTCLTPHQTPSSPIYNFETLSGQACLQPYFAVFAVPADLSCGARDARNLRFAVPAVPARRKRMPATHVLLCLRGQRGCLQPAFCGVCGACGARRVQLIFCRACGACGEDEDACCVCLCSACAVLSMPRPLASLAIDHAVWRRCGGTRGKLRTETTCAHETSIGLVQKLVHLFVLIPLPRVLVVSRDSVHLFESAEAHNGR